MIAMGMVLFIAGQIPAWAKRNLAVVPTANPAMEFAAMVPDPAANLNLFALRTPISANRFRLGFNG